MERLIQVLIELDVNPTNVDAIREKMHLIVNAVRADEPDTRGYRWHINEAESKVYIIECFNTGEALSSNLLHIGPSLAALAQLAPIRRWDIFGKINDPLARWVLQTGEKFGFKITIHGELLGFTREDLVAA